jgi:putative ABC transport system permease protein
MQSLWQDVRYAARGLRKQPGFTVVASLTIALGIGATALVFSLISSLLLRPLPVMAPDRLVTIHEERSGNVEIAMGQSAFFFERYEAFEQALQPVFSGLAAHAFSEGSLRTADAAEMVNVIATSANYFDVLGLRPALGGFFAPDANRSEANTAVISAELWARQFGSDPGVIGRVLHLNSQPYTVIGVAPSSFTGTIAVIPFDVWIPATRDTQSMVLFGRLREGTTRETARAAVAVVSQQVPPDHPSTIVEGVVVEPLAAIPGGDGMRAATIGFLAMLQATALLVLLIASANVGGMLLARASSRQREVAIRMALGAGRRRLIQQLVTESVMLFLLGAAGGVALTVWVTRMLSDFQLPVAMRLALDVAVDLRVLAFACAMALVTGIVFGFLPALHASRAELSRSLRDGERGQSGRSRVRSAFVVAQLAMSMLLLVTAGLFVRTLQSALASDIGFNPNGVVVGAFSLDRHGYDEARGLALQQQLLERVRALPGVESAAYASAAPMGGSSMTTTVRRGDAPEGPEAPGVATNLGTIDAGYLATLEIPLVGGRNFDSQDQPGSAPVVIVNQTLAQRLWPGENPLGQGLRVDGQVREVVGIARNGKYEQYTEDARAFTYLPLSQSYLGSPTLFVRSRADAAATLNAVRQELVTLDADVALEHAMPLNRLIGISIFPQRLAATLIGIFGLVGLLLAAIGLYGVLAYHVSARTREIGIRMAVGAPAAYVLGQVMRQSAVLVAGGIALGLGAALGLTRLMSSLLYDVSPTDPSTFIGVPVLLLGIALIASYLPARRASRVDPMVALRAE